jgi:SAM-dependent methyltransferase
MTQPRLESPSPFITEWIAASAGSLPRRRALDVAMGRGRHAPALVEQGFDVFGVDVDVETLRAAVAALGLGASLKVWCADLTSFPLPRERFELVLVTRYLQRDLFSALDASLVPGGLLLYETFTEAQRALGRGPTSPDHLLQAGELREQLRSLDVLFYEEVTAPEALARLAARKPFSRS